jgi:CRISPR-associated protein Cmr5
MMVTYDQKMAQEAFRLVSDNDFRRGKNEQYRSLAKSFPALIHSCGLAQAVAFAYVKNSDYVNNLAAVIGVAEAHITSQNLAEQSRTAEIAEYIRLSRHAISAASWLKRYTSVFDDEMYDNTAANAGDNREDEPDARRLS